MLYQSLGYVMRLIRIYRYSLYEGYQKSLSLDITCDGLIMLTAPLVLYFVFIFSNSRLKGSLGATDENKWVESGRTEGHEIQPDHSHGVSS